MEEAGSEEQAVENAESTEKPEVPVEEPKTEEKPNGAQAKSGGRRKEMIVCEIENQVGWAQLDYGPNDEGFKGQAQALEAIKKHVQSGIDEGLLDVNQLPAFRVIRVVRVITPSPVERIEIDFGDE